MSDRMTKIIILLHEMNKKMLLVVASDGWREDTVNVGYLILLAEGLDFKKINYKMIITLPNIMAYPF